MAHVGRRRTASELDERLDGAAVARLKQLPRCIRCGIIKQFRPRFFVCELSTTTCPGEFAVFDTLVEVRKKARA